MSKNYVELEGNAGKDAEVRFTGSGSKVVTFSLATGGGKKKDGSGEWPTDWHQIKCWNDAADQAEVIRKGSKVAVKGRISYESWEDRKTGEKKYKTVIVAREVEVSDGSTRPEGRELAEKRGESAVDTDLPF